MKHFDRNEVNTRLPMIMLMIKNTITAIEIWVSRMVSIVVIESNLSRRVYF